MKFSVEKARGPKNTSPQDLKYKSVLLKLEIPRRYKLWNEILDLFPVIVS